MTSLLALLLFASPAATPAAPAEPVNVIAKATLADLAWMEGHWRGEGSGGSTTEESWHAKTGESMLGSFRMVGADGAARFYEILLVLETPKGLEMRIRHFDRLFVALEEKDTPMVFRLAELARNRAVFEALIGGVRERIVYSREKDELVIRVEKPGKTNEFKMRLAR